MKSLKRIAWKTRLALQGGVLGKYHQLLLLQWLDRYQAEALQMSLLAWLLDHAIHHVPYYRRVLGGRGVLRSDGSIAAEGFSRIPLLDKKIIRTHFHELRSDDLDKRDWYENTSGGSTGEPVRFIQDRHYREMSVAVKILYDLWSGYAIGDRKVLLWGSERDLLRGKEDPKVQAGRWLRNEVALNAYRMTPSQMREYVETINSSAPVQILAYSGSIYELARFIEREGLKVHMPKSIISTATVLEPHMRETIERVFHAPVFDRYGSREVGDIACECNQHRGLHISVPTHYVEALRPDGSPADPGETGEIVVTSLTNYAMPLIRYRIGDMGALSASGCACGRDWPLLKNLAGRVTDIFLTKEGTRIYGGMFTRFLYYQDWIRKFQVTQESFDHIRIRIVPRSAGDNRTSHSDELQKITGKICTVMGADCTVEYDFVDDITPTPSGKHRYTVSKVVQ